MPEDLLKYRYCLGRVGRVGNPGKSLVFYHSFVPDPYVNNYVGTDVKLVHNISKISYDPSVHDRGDFEQVVANIKAEVDAVVTSETGTLREFPRLPDSTRQLHLVQIRSENHAPRSETSRAVRPDHSLNPRVGHSNPWDLPWSVCWAAAGSSGVYGGVSIGLQLMQLSKGASIVIGTPGRILHLLNIGGQMPPHPLGIVLGKVRHIVLDEADALLKDCFKKKMDAILKWASDSAFLDVNKWFLSSQYPDEELSRAEAIIDEIEFDPAADPRSDFYDTAGKVRKNYRRIDNDVPGKDESQRYTQVQQEFIEVECSGNDVPFRKKLAQSIQHLASSGPKRYLVLLHKRADIDQLEHALMTHSPQIKCMKLHGDIEQEHREQAIYQFKHGFVPILVTTIMLGGRRHNFDDVAELILFDLPLDLESYKFPLCRVGRNGNKAKSTAFYTQGDNIMDPALAAFLKNNKQTVPPYLERRGVQQTGGDT